MLIIVDRHPRIWPSDNMNRHILGCCAFTRVLLEQGGGGGGGVKVWTSTRGAKTEEEATSGNRLAQDYREYTLTLITVIDRIRCQAFVVREDVGASELLT